MLCTLLYETSESFKFSNSTNTKNYIYDPGWNFKLVLMTKFNFYTDKIDGGTSHSFCSQLQLWESMQCCFLAV